MIGNEKIKHEANLKLNLDRKNEKSRKSFFFFGVLYHFNDALDLASALPSFVTVVLNLYWALDPLHIFLSNPENCPYHPPLPRCEPGQKKKKKPQTHRQKLIAYLLMLRSSHWALQVREAVQWKKRKRKVTENYQNVASFENKYDFFPFKHMGLGEMPTVLSINYGFNFISVLGITKGHSLKWYFIVLSTSCNYIKYH